MIKNLVVFTILVGSVSLWGNLVQAACNADQAAAKLAKLFQALDKRIDEVKTSEETQKLFAAYRKINETSIYYQKKDYTSVCNIYDKVAKENNIKL